MVIQEDVPQPKPGGTNEPEPGRDPLLHDVDGKEEAELWLFGADRVVVTREPDGTPSYTLRQRILKS